MSTTLVFVEIINVNFGLLIYKSAIHIPISNNLTLFISIIWLVPTQFKSARFLIITVEVITFHCENSLII